MKALYLLLAGCLLSSCSLPKQPQWTEADFVGSKIELIDLVTVESMTFMSDGSVPMTVGQRNGPLAGPVYYWAFVSGRLRITTDDKQLYDEFTLISRDAETMKVRRHNGQVACFTVLLAGQWLSVAEKTRLKQIALNAAASPAMFEKFKVERVSTEPIKLDEQRIDYRFVDRTKLQVDVLIPSGGRVGWHSCFIGVTIARGTYDIVSMRESFWP
jgi:hypothetical protein